MPAYHKKVRIPGKSAQELYDRISKEIDVFLETASLGKFELNRDTLNKEIRLKSSMFTGKLTCSADSLELSGSLSFLALPFKSKLDDGIDRWLSKHFKCLPPNPLS